MSSRNENTIAAISTPPGEGGVAVIRISGNDAHSFLQRIFIPASRNGFSERRLSFGRIVEPDTGETVDEVLCVVMSAPATYTGENLAEIHCHGGYLVPRKILELLTGLGARLAAPGEFTERAYLNGKMDLAQAEAVSDIISAQTEQSLKYAEAQLQGALSDRINGLKDRLLDVLAEIEANLDFPEEDVDSVARDRLRTVAESVEKDLLALLKSYDTGRMFREGVSMVILGKPNVGKSSLLNCLLRTRRAIVSPEAGTTRDFIEEKINICGIPVVVTDTAGIRDSGDQVEKLGVQLSMKKAAEAEFVLVVLDRSAEFDRQDQKILDTVTEKKHLIVLNKADLENRLEETAPKILFDGKNSVRTSAVTMEGMDDLRQSIFENLAAPQTAVDAGEMVITNLRHKNSIQKTVDHLRDFLDVLHRDQYPEILSVEMKSAVDSLGEITGEVTTEDVLGRIFSRFCIGK